MLQYKDLSPAQRRWVELVEIYFPNIQRTVNYAELKQIHTFFVEKRSEDPRFKISKPLWLITHNAISRGTYEFPGSKRTTENITAVSDPEALYRAELEKFLIKI